MSEQQIKEPRAAYAPAAVETGERTTERLQETVQIQFPPYFERFLEERDRRLSSDLAHLRVEIQHIREEIGLLRADTERRLAEAKGERESLHAEVEHRFTKAGEEMERRFAEAREERKALRQEMVAHLRWTLGLLFPIILGVLAIVFKVFFGMP